MLFQQQIPCCCSFSSATHLLRRVYCKRRLYITARKDFTLDVLLAGIRGSKSHTWPTNEDENPLNLWPFVIVSHVGWWLLIITIIGNGEAHRLDGLQKSPHFAWGRWMLLFDAYWCKLQLVRSYQLTFRNDSVWLGLNRSFSFTAKVYWNMSISTVNAEYVPNNTRRHA